MRSRSTVLTRLLLAVVLVSLAGCATRTDVQEIVGLSNDTLLSQYDLRQADQILGETELPGLAPPDGDRDSREAWSRRVQEQRDQAIARIDAFIQKHAQNTNLERTVHALRLRKAVLLAMSGERNLALATFAEVDRTKAGNARDAALIDSSEALVWWWEVAPAENVPPAQFRSDAARHVRTLDGVIERTPKGSGIYYYLATLRAHVHLKWASVETDRRIKLREGLRTYCSVFEDEARGHVKTWVSKAPDESKSIPTENLRWFGHVPITFEAYDATYRKFLDELREFDPRDLDPALREAAQETEPVWPPECEWITGLERRTQ